MEWFRLLIKYTINVVLNVFKVFSVKKNRVFILNELSYTYGCNPKYLCEYLYMHYGDKLKIVYPLAADPEIQNIPKEFIIVKPQSLFYFYYIMTSKVVVTNAGGISYVPFRKSQMVINTWHGGGAYKKGGIDVMKGTAYHLEALLNAKKTTFILASTRLMKDEFSRAFLISKNKFLETGIPRIDIFFKDMSKIREKVRNYYGIPCNAKIAMYCPSFRSDESGHFLQNDMNLDSEKLLTTIKNKWSDEWYFAERLHPKLKVQSSESSIKNLNFTKYPDMQELLCAVDIVISDYSGLIWDFSFTKKPCFIYAEDIVEYQENVGFYAPIESWPFPIALNEKELIDNIMNFDQEQYVRRIENHYKVLGSFEKGTASQVVGDKIYEYCFNGLNK